VTVSSRPLRQHFALGTTTVTGTATDVHGKCSKPFTITVQDNDSPASRCPPTSRRKPRAPPVSGNLRCHPTDLWTGNVTINSTPSSGSTFPIGTTTVNWHRTDDTTHCPRQLHRDVRDTTPPSLTLPGQHHAEATSAAGAGVNYVATATDIVDGSVAVNSTPSSGSTFALGAHHRERHRHRRAWQTGHRQLYRDGLRDMTPPAITGQPTLLPKATSAAGAVVTFTASALDIVDGAVTVSSTPAPPAPLRWAHHRDLHRE